MANYLVAKCGNTTKSYELKNTEPSKPYIKVSNSYLQLESLSNSATYTGFVCKNNNVNYGIAETKSTTTTVTCSVYMKYSDSTSNSSYYPNQWVIINSVAWRDALGRQGGACDTSMITLNMPYEIFNGTVRFQVKSTTTGFNNIYTRVFFYSNSSNASIHTQIISYGYPNITSIAYSYSYTYLGTDKVTFYATNYKYEGYQNRQSHYTTCVYYTSTNSNNGYTYTLQGFQITTTATTSRNYGSYTTTNLCYKGSVTVPKAITSSIGGYMKYSFKQYNYNVINGTQFKITYSSSIYVSNYSSSQKQGNSYSVNMYITRRNDTAKSTRITGTTKFSSTKTGQVYTADGNRTSTCGSNNYTALCGFPDLLYGAATLAPIIPFGNGTDSAFESITMIHGCGYQYYDLNTNRLMYNTCRDIYSVLSNIYKSASNGKISTEYVYGGISYTYTNLGNNGQNYWYIVQTLPIPSYISVNSMTTTLSFANKFTSNSYITISDVYISNISTDYYGEITVSVKDYYTRTITID